MHLSCIIVHALYAKQIPFSGPVIVIFNHVEFFDNPLIFIYAPPSLWFVAMRS